MSAVRYHREGTAERTVKATSARARPTAFATSSPAVPTVMLRLVGEAYDPLSTRDAGVAAVDAGDAAVSTADGGSVVSDASVAGDAGETLYEQSPDGCGCRAAGASGRRTRGAWALSVGALALLRRRRRDAR